jgi:fructose-1,6-bisphosphatase/inositol monophosphatase family enzyme
MNHISSSEISELLSFALNLTFECRKLALEKISAGLNTETKIDKSFVTQVDKGLEEHVRNEVKKRFPTHSVLGEEFGLQNPGNPICWITDPIDGTQNLVHGIPTFGFVLGVWFNSTPLIGIIDHPLLKETFYSSLNMGAFKLVGDSLESGKLQRITIGDRTFNDNEIVTLSTRDCFERCSAGEIFDKAVKKFPSTRVYYDIFSTSRTVQGASSATIEYGMKIWDVAATESLITEAGGVCNYVAFDTHPTRGNMVSLLCGRKECVEAIQKKLSLPSIEAGEKEKKILKLIKQVTF